jgi:aryl-alcohol dehydrogenase-like predicted oxidoreductase
MFVTTQALGGFMKYRTLGGTGLRVSEIGFGAMTISGFFGETDDRESLRALHKALDLGLNFIDTADTYGGGRSEALIGQVLKERRGDVIVATKGGSRHHIEPGKPNFDPDYISAAIDASLMRLGIEQIDLYQLHSPAPAIIRDGALFARLERHKHEGKIRHYGVSAATTADALIVVRETQAETVQLVYNIIHQDPAEELLPLASEKGVGVIVRVPLERGILAGRFLDAAKFGKDDWRKQRFTDQDLAQLNAAIAKLGFLVRDDVPSLAQAALRFCLSNPAVSTVIAGVRTVAQAEDNASASGKYLNPHDLHRIAELYTNEFKRLPHLR